MPLAPVERVTAAQTAAKEILASIQKGTFKAGERLPGEKELMRELKIGRSTVREALQILATLNVIHANPGQGTFIKEPTTSNFFRPDILGLLISNSVAIELLEAREIIEPAAVRLACIRGTEADYDNIARVLDAHEAARKQNQPVSEYAAQFHVLIAEASHNQVIARLMASIFGILRQRGRKVDHIPDYYSKEIQDHKRILQLIRSRDEVAAVGAMIEHILESAATYDVEKSRGELNPADEGVMAGA